MIIMIKLMRMIRANYDDGHDDDVDSNYDNDESNDKKG